MTGVEVGLLIYALVMALILLLLGISEAFRGMADQPPPPRHPPEWYRPRGKRKPAMAPPNRGSGGRRGAA